MKYDLAIQALEEKVAAIRAKAEADCAQYLLAIEQLKGTTKPRLATANGQTVEVAPLPHSSAAEGERAPKGQAKIVLELLKRSPDIWMDQMQISAALDQAGTPIKRSSLQPVLSKLRTSGEVARDGLKVAHPSRLAHTKAAE